MMSVHRPGAGCRKYCVGVNGAKGKGECRGRGEN